MAKRLSSARAENGQARTVGRLCAAAWLCGTLGCDVEDEGPVAEPPPEGLGTATFASINCAEHYDTGYVDGSPFRITLVTINGHPAEVSTANAYYVMQQAAEAAGVAVRVVSGFRTWAEQEYFYNCRVCCCCNSCNPAAAPGYSNHQSGHALDLNTGSGAGVLTWLNAHGGAYGFSRTVAGEPWHWEWWGGGPGGGPCGCTPSDETCDNRDNDCDGDVDEGLSRDCGTNVGECTRGRESCAAGRWVGCTGRGPAGEACNERDDDCDGATDEDLSRRCGTDVGTCVFGAQACAAGAWGSCVGAIDPVPETCDDLDNDCDGATDEERICDIEEAALPAPWFDPGVTSDLDGDGRADLCARTADGIECRLASGHGFETLVAGPRPIHPGADADPSVWAMLRTGDIDGDGSADLCARDGDEIACWQSTGHAFGTRRPGPSLAAAGGCREPSCYTTLRLIDVTGDGRADLCFRAPDGFRCHPSLGGGFAPASLVPALGDDAGCADVSCYATIRLGDIDGDGRADLCARTADGVRCWRSGEDGFGEQLRGPPWSDADGWSPGEYSGTVRLGDVDGDGRADLCARSPTDFRCYLSTGGGFEGPVLLAAMGDADGWTAPSRWSTIRLADVDGDGAMDVCARDADGVACWLWTGRGFARRLPGPALADVDGWDLRPRYRTLRFGDADGDGRADLCARAADGVRCWLSDGAGFPTQIFGPAWTDEDGWELPQRHGSMVFAGPTPGTARPVAGRPGAGCACAVPPPAATGTPAAGLLLAAAALGLRSHGRRRRS